jgi:hypothetical protein
MTMAGLFRNNPETSEGKYLVKRRDGTIPEWMWFVLGSADPNAPAGLRGYADEAEKNGFDPRYVADVRAMADEWERELASGSVPVGDPDAPRHRIDDPATVAEMAKGRGA